METRANYLVVGGFTLIALISAFVMAVWLAKTSFDTRYATYDIYFAGSVAGLKVGGDVLYNGIRTGEVRSIRVAPRDPGRVRVRIEIDTAIPVGEDTVASLELQGLTGVAAIQLAGGSAYSSALPTMPGEDYPIIRSRRSTLDELIQGVPGLMTKATDVLARLNQILSDENRDSVRMTLQNVATLTGSLADPKSDMRRLLTNSADAAAEFKIAGTRIAKLSEKLDSLAAQSDEAMRQDLRPLVQDAREAVHAIGSLAQGLDETRVQAAPGIQAFADQGLPELTAAARDLRQLAQTLDRVLRRFESDPARFLLGDPKNGYQPK
jgi:phospholipid/cholesterol/gamma-HCH transport system substrate-binding protein